MHKNTWKNMALVAGSLTLTTGFADAASTLVNLGNNAPTGNIIASEESRNSFTRAFDIEANANHARGMVFTTGDNATGGQFAIDSITVSKDTTQTFVGGEVTLFVYQGSVADWTAGNGDTTETAADIYDGTTVTPLFEETFALNGSYGANSYLQFSLDSSLIVDENSEFGFFLIYSKGDANDDDYLQLDERSSGGGQIRLTDTANEVNGTRGLTFYVQGTAVPEPSSAALLGLGGLALMLRRRK
ncbi:PEP-CTERM sorting domain-containing protein [Verrucomicrobiaceae bacterium 5K15]|uniref:PEP-CTERM sorting domain-containing protein n=1 Tax=Oceaniferula flava TaxID=2800421 RepID=A0AAE2VCE2_9BACT|nr:PEP-CTERM sorting domain-containing protein [Oceaniferula flavus]MBK1854891.1 PEP-CTERM sorting domain-containing protein [Oceaniferula flavus]MBM1136197.1 PEP-CTERM sorting domain-containing protein [Oceaniferula flavus]